MTRPDEPDLATLAAIRDRPADISATALRRVRPTRETETPQPNPAPLAPGDLWSAELGGITVSVRWRDHDTDDDPKVPATT
ncbi:hypothetical protein ABZ867_27425 [Streptomyces cinnamoneus]